jgi:hypothetical protein
MPRGNFASAKQDQYMVRLPDGMRDQLKKQAERNCRTMNSEIVFLLRNAIEETETKKADARA